jgi:LysM repeat protein
MKTEPLIDSPDLFQTDPRARKQIPIAVFTVIAIHILLFLVLLVSAGCKPKGQANVSDSENPKNLENKKARSTASTAPTPAPVQKPDELQCEPLPVSSTAPLPAARSLKANSGPKQGNVMAYSAPKDTGAAADRRIHIVQPGESLSKIARAYNTTPQALRTSNNLRSDVIRVGQKLKIG